MIVSEESLESVIPYIRNPRKNEDSIEKVAASIKEFGFRQPIVVDSGNVIVAGHTRYEAAKRLGLKTIPVHVAGNLTPQQVKSYRIADNRVSQESEWDQELLKLELEELERPESSGFEPEEISEILQELSFDPTAEDEQPDLGVIDPKLVTCPNCGEDFDLRAKN